MHESVSVVSTPTPYDTLWTITTANGVSAEVSSLGATLRSLRVQGTEITLGYQEPWLWFRNPAYFGVTVGRYANRIDRGAYTLDGKTLQLHPNADGNHLHGGYSGYHSRQWTGTTIHTTYTFEGDALPSREYQAAGVKLSLHSPDGDEHYPGNLEASVTILLLDDGSLVFDYQARTDAPTPCNLTNHTYWNIDGEGSMDLTRQRLQLNSLGWLPVENGIPRGPVSPQAGSPFDFRQATALGPVLAAGGIDHHFFLDPRAPQVSPRADSQGPRPPLRQAARIEGQRMAMEVWTDKPGFQIYTGNFIPPGQSRQGPLKRQGAICIETQIAPDSPNQGPRYAQWAREQKWPEPPAHPWDGILRPGADYRSLTLHRFLSL